LQKAPDVKFLADEGLREKKFLELFEKFSDKLKGHIVVIDKEKFRFRRI
jgi:hypothetical protein